MSFTNAVAGLTGIGAGAPWGCSEPEGSASRSTSETGHSKFSLVLNFALLGSQLFFFGKFARWASRFAPCFKKIAASNTAIFSNVLLSSLVEFGNQSWRGKEEGRHLDLNPSEWNLLPWNFFILNNFVAGISTDLLNGSRLMGGRRVEFGKSIGWIEGFRPNSRVFLKPLARYVGLCGWLNALVTVPWVLSLLPYLWATPTESDKKDNYIFWTALTYLAGGFVRIPFVYRYVPSGNSTAYYGVSDVSFGLFQGTVVYFKGAYLS